MVLAADRRAERFRRFERQVASIRWCGIALGVFLVWARYRAPGSPVAPTFFRPVRPEELDAALQRWVGSEQESDAGMSATTQTERVRGSGFRGTPP